MESVIIWFFVKDMMLLGNLLNYVQCYLSVSLLHTTVLDASFQEPVINDGNTGQRDGKTNVQYEILRETSFNCPVAAAPQPQCTGFHFPFPSLSKHLRVQHLDDLNMYLKFACTKSRE